MMCTQCGADSGSAKFCPDCGAPQQAQAASVVCAHCGTAFSSRFCPDCGTPAAATAQRPPEAIQLVAQPAPAPLAKTLFDDGSGESNVHYTQQTIQPPAAGASPVIVIRNETTMANVNTNTVANVNDNVAANVGTSTLANAREAAAPGAYYGTPYAQHSSPKSRLAALLWSVFLGYFGGHQYYAGKIGMGLLYTFTVGLFGMGWLVDTILIACGLFRDSQGRRITEWK